MNTMEKTLHYESAYAELAGIAKEIEAGSVSLDVLADKVRRASELIVFCQSKLRDTETEVNKIIESLQPGEGS